MSERGKPLTEYPPELIAQASSILEAMLTQKVGSEEARRRIEAGRKFYRSEVQAAFVACACAGIEGALFVTTAILDGGLSPEEMVP